MVKEQVGTESLILTRCCNFPIYSQVGQKSFYLGYAPTSWVFFVAKKYVLFDQIQISPFSFIGILFQENGTWTLSRSFLGFGFISTDIINYDNLLWYNLHQIFYIFE